MAYEYTEDGITYYRSGGTTWQVTTSGLVLVPDMRRPLWRRLLDWLKTWL